MSVLFAISFMLAGFIAGLLLAEGLLSLAASKMREASGMMDMANATLDRAIKKNEQVLKWLDSKQ